MNRNLAEQRAVDGDQTSPEGQGVVVNAEPPVPMETDVVEEPVVEELAVIVEPGPEIEEASQDILQDRSTHLTK